MSLSVEALYLALEDPISYHLLCISTVLHIKKIKKFKQIRQLSRYGVCNLSRMHDAKIMEIEQLVCTDRYNPLHVINNVVVTDSASFSRMDEK